MPLTRTALTGYFIVLSAITFLVGQVTALPLFVPALCAWIVVFLAFPGMKSSACKQTLILSVLGIVMICWAVIRQTPVNWKVAIGGNLPLLTMFVGVTFLGLTNPDPSQDHLPRGKKGILSNLLTSHLLGAVINISIIFIVGDRLSQKRQLSPAQALTMMRGFTAAAFWSPFFVAAGVALIYAPGSQWTHTIVPGLALAALLGVISFIDAYRLDANDFEGYPLQYDSLFIPLLLAAAVMFCHWLLPTVRILTLISLIAPIGALLFMRERPRLQQTLLFIRERLANIASQFAIFLAAGVFSSGVVAIINSYPDTLALHLDHFTPILFMAFSGFMIIVALIGVHPVASVALISPFLVPMGINPDQLAFMFLSAYGIAIGASPLSGVGLVMSSRYQVSSSTILRVNRLYLIIIWLLSGLINMVWFV